MASKVEPGLRIRGLPNATIGNFWSWAYSDLVSNTIRPMFAEYLVGECLELTEKPRVEWDSVDFRYRNRGIEVKSAGYVQTWTQLAPSVISFDIAPKAAPWDAASNFILPGGRSAEVYVLCVHTDRTRDSCCVHDSTKWDFYVLSTKHIAELFGTQKTIRLSRLVGHCSPVSTAN